MTDCTLFQGNCLDIMPTLPAQSVDAIICDPPYGVTGCKWDSAIPTAAMWACIEHLLKPCGVVVLFGCEPFSSLLRVSKLDWYKYDWIWKKTMPTGFLNAKNMPMSKHEIISVFSGGAIAHIGKSDRRMAYRPQMGKGKPYVKHNYVDTRTMWGGAKRIGSADYTQRNTGQRYPTTILEYANTNNDSLHPTQKPVDLLSYLIRTYSEPGETVLDFTMGSGSTGEACALTGRGFVGIELDPDYYQIAEPRIATAYSLENRQPRKVHQSEHTDLPLFTEVSA